MFFCCFCLCFSNYDNIVITFVFYINSKHVLLFDFLTNVCIK